MKNSDFHDRNGARGRVCVFTGGPSCVPAAGPAPGVPPVPGSLGRPGGGGPTSPVHAQRTASALLSQEKTARIDGTKTQFTAFTALRPPPPPGTQVRGKPSETRSAAGSGSRCRCRCRPARARGCAGSPGATLSLFTQSFPVTCCTLPCIMPTFWAKVLREKHGCTLYMHTMITCHGYNHVHNACTPRVHTVHGKTRVFSSGLVSESPG